MNITLDSNSIIFENLVSSVSQDSDAKFAITCDPGKPFVAKNAPGTLRTISGFEEISAIARTSAKTLKDFMAA